MKRKALAILLTMLMLSCNSGLLLATHFCKGKALYTSLGLSSGKSCGMAGKCNKEQKPCGGFGFSATSCCKQQIQQLSLKKEFTGARKSFITSYPEVPVVSGFIFSLCHLRTFLSFTVYHSPSASPPSGLLSLIQTFRL